ncbi:hypothetical protein U1Q18_022843, partial [Sarracenia purpurea var. burkii]
LRLKLFSKNQTRLVRRSGEGENGEGEGGLWRRPPCHFRRHHGKEKEGDTGNVEALKKAKYGKQCSGDVDESGKRKVRRGRRRPAPPPASSIATGDTENGGR